MPSSFESPPVITGKRKRATISYVEENVDVIHEEDTQDPAEDDVRTDSDDDVEYGKRITKKQKMKKRQAMLKNKARLSKPKKPQPEKHFRFMDLSAELRNRIYEMTLTDANGLLLVPKTKAYRRTVCRGQVFDKAFNSAGDGYWRRRLLQKSDPQETAPKQTDLVPNLLVVSKQVYSEGINYLYNQDLFFADTMALHQFLANIGPDNQKHLLSIAIKSWGTGTGAHKAMNHCAFALLAGATKLEALLIDCQVGYGRHSSGSLARQVYREMHFFLEAYGHAKGNKRAGIDIIELSGHNFQGASSYQRRRDADSETSEEIEQKFKKALGGLLEAK